jgi:hypothetical protein
MSIAARQREIAQMVYDHAGQNYNDTKARWDTIVECMTIDEIAEELAKERIFTKSAAIRHYRQFAKLQHEAYLNTEAHLHKEW